MCRNTGAVWAPQRVLPSQPPVGCREGRVGKERSLSCRQENETRGTGRALDVVDNKVVDHTVQVDEEEDHEV